MKKLFTLILLFSIYCVSQSMDYSRPHWQDSTDSFLKIKTVQHIVKEGGLTIPLVTRYKKMTGNKTVFLFLVYSDEDQQKQCYESYSDDIYKSVQCLLLDLPTHIDNCIPGTFCLISCKYSEKNENVSRSLAALMHQAKQQGGVIATYAFGDSAHIVNLATREYKKEFGKHDSLPVIDTMIHVQSPMYEYSWSWLKQKYEHNKQFSPTSFKNLYHFYTKIALPVSLYNVLTYPDRKYRQKNNESYDGKKSLPVKNFRLLKQSKDNQLVDMSVQELRSGFFIKRINDLLSQAHKYRVNFDLIAKTYSDQNSFESSVVMVNRLVGFENGTMFLKYGDKTDQRYTFGSLSEKSDVSQIAFKERIWSKYKLERLIAKCDDSFKNNKDLKRVYGEHKSK